MEKSQFDRILERGHQPVAISYTWNQKWGKDGCLEAHPDPSVYYLGMVCKTLHVMSKTREYNRAMAAVCFFWVRAACLVMCPNR